jgi:hypothetical protein
VTLEPHLGSALNVQDDPVPVIAGRDDSFGTGLPGQLEKVAAVEAVKPGQPVTYMIGVHPASRDACHMFRFRDKIGVRGNSRKSASAASARRPCCQPAGSRSFTLNVVQLELSGMTKASE